MSGREDEVGLSSLEQRLRDRRAAEPSEEWKAVLMRAVDRELRSTTPPRQRGMGLFSYAAALMAALIVAANFSVALTSQTSFSSKSSAAVQPIADSANGLQQIAPDLSRDEAMRMAVLLQAGDRILPLPEAHGSVAFIDRRVDLSLFDGISEPSPR